jgi:hypothetical protein
MDSFTIHIYNFKKQNLDSLVEVNKVKEDKVEAPCIFHWSAAYIVFM